MGDSAAAASEHGMHGMGQSGHMMGSDMGDNSTMMMQMVFYQSVQATILFKGVMTKDMGGYLLAIVLIAAAAVFRNWLTTIDPNPPNKPPVQIKGTRSVSAAAPSAGSAALIPSGSGGKARARYEASGCGACLRGALSNLTPAAVLLQVANVSLGYLLMLVAMTFNTGLFFAVVVGEAVGRVMFHGQNGQDEAMTSGDACH